MFRFVGYHILWDIFYILDRIGEVMPEFEFLAVNQTTSAVFGGPNLDIRLVANSICIKLPISIPLFYLQSKLMFELNKKQFIVENYQKRFILLMTN